MLTKKRLMKMYIKIGIIKDLFKKGIISEDEMNNAILNIFKDNKMFYK